MRENTLGQENLCYFENGGDKAHHFIPLPYSGKLILFTPNFNFSGNKLIIYDLSGRKIQKIHLENKYQHEVDLSHLPTGIYAASLYSDQLIKSILFYAL